MTRNSFQVQFALLIASTSVAVKGATLAEVIKGQPQLSTLLNTVEQFKELTDALTGAGNFTVFAPDNAAFEAIKGTVAMLSKDDLKKVLKNHIVKDSKIMAADLKEVTLKTLNGDLKIVDDKGTFKFGVVRAEVVKGMVDIPAENGVVHVINKVLTGAAPPTKKPEPSPEPSPSPSAPGGLKTIAQALGDVPNLSMLKGALEGVGLIDALGGKGPFTVFAPSNAALEKDEEEVNTAANTPANLKKLLLRHVVAGKKITPDQFSEEKKEFGTMNDGDKVMIWKVAEKKMVGFKEVVAGVDDKASVEAANGVIHIISDVLVIKDEFASPQNATEAPPKETKKQTSVRPKETTSGGNSIVVGCALPLFQFLATIIKIIPQI